MIRALLSITLSLVLVLTSHSAGMAKASPAAVDQMVICTGLGTTVIYTDADGRPTTTPHLCPDCVVHLDGAVVPPKDVLIVMLEAGSNPALVQADVVPSAKPLVTPRVRAPPGLI